MRVRYNHERQAWEVWLELRVVASFSKEHEAVNWMKAELARRSVVTESA